MKLKFAFMNKDNVEYMPKRYDWLRPESHGLAYNILGRNKKQVKKISRFNKTNLHNPRGHTNLVVKLSGDCRWWDLDFFKLVFKFKKVGYEITI